MTCPNGNSTVCGAGKPEPNTNADWKGGIAMADNQPVPGWYLADATYDKAPSDQRVICKNNAAVDPKW